MHYPEGILQEYLDNQLSYEEIMLLEKHLTRCAKCREKLQQLVREEQVTKDKLELYAKALATPEPDIQQAWGKLAAKLQQEEKSQADLEKVSTFKTKKRGWKFMQKGWHKWVAGVAAAAIFLGAFSLPPVQSATAQFLKVFRVERIETVKLTTEDLQRIKGELESKMGTVDLHEFGEVEVLQTPGSELLSADEAEGRYGFSSPTYLPAGAVPEAKVALRTGEKLAFTLDVDRVNEAIAQLGGKTPLPATLEGKTFTLEFKDQLTRRYELPEQSFWVSAMEVPRIEVDADVRPVELMQSLLDLPILPYSTKRQLQQISDFENALILPASEDMDTISINGVPVLRTSASGSEYCAYMWLKDGWLYNMHSYGGLTTQEAEKVVESLL